MNRRMGGGPRRRQNDGTQKPKNRKETLLRLWSYLYYYRFKVIVSLIFTVVSNLLSLLGPLLIGRVIKTMENPVDFSKFNDVYLYSGLMVIFYITSAILSYILSRMMVKVSQDVTYKMRKDVFDKLNRVEIRFFDEHLTGDIISVMSYDIDTVNSSLASDFISILNSIVTVVISFIMMAIISPILLLIFFVTIPLSILITRKLSKIVKEKYRIRNRKLGQLNGYAEEIITGHKTIRSYVLESEVANNFKEINQEATDASYESGYYGTSVGPAIGFVSNLSVALVGIIGGLLYFLHKIGLDQFTSFTLYARRFSGPINNMSSIYAEIQSALAAAERVFGIIDQPDEVNESEDAINYLESQGNLEFNDVTFGYVTDVEVLKNISFSAQSGDMIAIVGPTGSGKTTLVNLLMKFYLPNTGAIYLDDHNIYDIKKHDLRKNFSMILQDTWMFYGSIYDNVLYGNEGKTKEDVVVACKKARIHHFIMGLPNGYDTIITEEGFNISKGQKQLLVIARALLSNSKMLIFDEATSNVDTHTEVLIQKAMLELMEGKTTFIIAHRLSTIMNAKKILVLKDGKLIESGNHEELLSQKGFYHQLFTSQFN